MVSKSIQIVSKSVQNRRMVNNGECKGVQDGVEKRIDGL